jgi:type IV secretory pathway VirB3-like protein
MLWTMYSTLSELYQNFRRVIQEWVNRKSEELQKTYWRCDSSRSNEIAGNLSLLF